MSEEDVAAEKAAAAAALEAAQEQQAADETKGLAESADGVKEVRPESTSTLGGIFGLQLQKGGLLDFFGNNDLR